MLDRYTVIIVLATGQNKRIRVPKGQDARQHAESVAVSILADILESGDTTALMDTHGSIHQISVGVPPAPGMDQPARRVAVIVQSRIIC